MAKASARPRLPPLLRESSAQDRLHAGAGQSRRVARLHESRFRFRQIDLRRHQVDDRRRSRPISFLLDPKILSRDQHGIACQLGARPGRVVGLVGLGHVPADPQLRVPTSRLCDLPGGARRVLDHV